MQRLRTVTSLDVSAVAGHHAMPAALLFTYLSFFSDVVMASHGGDETKTIRYMSKFLKYAPERACGGGRKEN